MSTSPVQPVLYLVVCAAPPALQVDELIKLMMDDGWIVCVIATPTAATWIDRKIIAEQTGYPVRCEFRRPDDVDPLPKADAVVVAPATFNTINKWATGISDSLALGILNEALGLGLPILASPYAKSTLIQHPAYARHVELLTGAGVTFTHPEAIRPHTSDQPFLWHLIQKALEEILRPPVPG
ncbi:flavoprotein [Micromonospora sp. NPDC003197]